MAPKVPIDPFLHKSWSKLVVFGWILSFLSTLIRSSINLYDFHVFQTSIALQISLEIHHSYVGRKHDNTYLSTTHWILSVKKKPWYLEERMISPWLRDMDIVMNTSWMTMTKIFTITFPKLEISRANTKISRNIARIEMPNSANWTAVHGLRGFRRPRRSSNLAEAWYSSPSHTKLFLSGTVFVRHWGWFFGGPRPPEGLGRGHPKNSRGPPKNQPRPQRQSRNIYLALLSVTTTKIGNIRLPKKKLSRESRWCHHGCSSVLCFIT